MICERMNFDDAKARIGEYDFAIIFEFSRKFFGEQNNLQEINWDECVEARFFSMEKELYFYRDDETDELTAVCTEDEPSDKDAENSGIMRYELPKNNRLPGNRRVLLVREYFSYDEDGQLLITGRRPAGVEQEV